MSRVYLLAPAGSEAETVAAVRELGVVHVTHETNPTGRDLEKEQRTLEEIHRALQALPSAPRASDSRDPAEVVEETLALLARRDEAEARRAHLQAVCREVEPYGDVDPETVTRLRENGLGIYLYQVPRKQDVELPDGYVYIDGGGDKHQRRFALIGRGEPSLPVPAASLPDQSLGAMQTEIRALEEELDAFPKQLHELGAHREAVARHARAQEARVRLLEVERGMGSGEAVVTLAGFCPAESLSAIREAAAREGWGLFARDVEEGDDVPTLLRNPRWVNLVKPVLDFVGILPGYREMDISMSFLLFFSLFFGMIVGDAGYGVIFLVLTLAARYRWQQARTFTSMMLVMSFSTIAWGVISGNYFGMPTGAVPGGLAALRIDWLTNEDNVMYVCFLIGAVHLTLAHVWRMILLLPRPEGIAQLGWIGTTWGMFFGACTMILGHPFPPVMLWVLLAGAVLIALFMTPIRKLKSQWFNHIVLPLDLVSNFVDVVSYVRLFAVGMATYAVAAAFNEMAMGIGFDSFLGGFGAALILFFGHVLNIALALMGVLVHGIRLNALEFSGHLGLEWLGAPYRPFARQTEGNAE